MDLFADRASAVAFMTLLMSRTPVRPPRNTNVEVNDEDLRRLSKKERRRLQIAKLRKAIAPSAESVAPLESLQVRIK